MTAQATATSSVPMTGNWFRKDLYIKESFFVALTRHCPHQTLRACSRHMPYCERCEKYFWHNRALWQHEEDSSRHHLCRPCNNDFTTWTSLKQHYVQSRWHAYCQLCNELFDSDSDESLEDHEDEEHYPCRSCDIVRVLFI